MNVVDCVFQPLQTLCSRGNMRNPARYETDTTQSDAKSVDIIEGTRFFLALALWTDSPRPKSRDGPPLAEMGQARVARPAQQLLTSWGHTSFTGLMSSSTKEHMTKTKRRLPGHPSP